MIYDVSIRTPWQGVAQRNENAFLRAAVGADVIPIDLQPTTANCCPPTLFAQGATVEGTKDNVDRFLKLWKRTWAAENRTGVKGMVTAAALRVEQAAAAVGTVIGRGAGASAGAIVRGAVTGATDAGPTPSEIAALEEASPLVPSSPVRVWIMFLATLTGLGVVGYLLMRLARR